MTIVVVAVASVAALALPFASAPPAAAAPPLNCAASGFTNIQPSEWQDQGPDVFQFLCNFGRGSSAPYSGGVAVTVRYQCPAATDDEWRSKTANRTGDLVNNKASEVAQSDEGSFSTFVGDFTRQERGFLRPDPNTIITVITYADTPGLYNQAKGPALSLASSHRASATLPCGSSPSTGPSSTDGPGRPPTTPRPTTPPTQPTTTVYTPPPTIPLTTSTQVPCFSRAACPTKPPKKLCDEATAMLTGWSEQKLKDAGIDPNASTMLYDAKDLTDQFQSAIDTYNASHRGEVAYATSSTPLSSSSALLWLFSEGGTLGDVVPEHSRAYVVGKEKDLRLAIMAESDARKRSGQDPLLNPGDVFRLSLDLTGGNAVQANLLAHNTLRSLGRNGDLGFTGVQFDSEFIPKYLTPMRGGTEQAGSWYHLFGMTYYKMQFDGDSGVPVGTMAGLAYLLGYVGTSATGIGAVLLGLAAVYGAGQVLLSPEIANQIEQLARKTDKEGRPQKIDAEKYCFNVIGQLLGKHLLESLPGSGERTGPPPTDHVYEPPITRDTRPEDIKSVEASTVANVMQSPYSIEWTVDGERVVMEQGGSPDDMRVLGTAPMALIPLQEKDNWGALWMTPPSAKHAMTFTATRDGAPMHFVRIDTKTADAFVYDPVAAKKGDRFTIAAVDESQTSPDMVGPDGKVIRPRKESLRIGGSNGFTATAPAPAAITPGRSTVPLLVLLGAVVAGLLLLLFVLLLRRRQAPPALATATAAGTSAFAGGPAATVAPGPSGATSGTPAATTAAAPPGAEPAGGATVYGYVLDSQPLLDRARAPLGSLEPGTWYEIVQRDGDWAEVRLPDGRTGWTAGATLHDR